MGYTKSKIRGINFSFLLAGCIFAGWALLCALYGWPRGFRAGSTAAFCLFAAVALFFISFPVIWARFPEKHPVNHELMRYGNLREISKRLDAEISDHVENLGPFHFTKSFLIYDSGHEFQMIPYDQIVSAKIEQPSSDDPVAIIVHTRSKRQYQWYRTWLQAIFDSQEVLKKIRAAARLDAADSSASSGAPVV